MKIGYPEILLMFAAIISFQSLEWSLGIAATSFLIAFFRFAIQVQEKKEAQQSAENATKILNEQAEELGKTLSKLFGNSSKKSKGSFNKKYNIDPDSDLH